MVGLFEAYRKELEEAEKIAKKMGYSARVSDIDIIYDLGCENGYRSVIESPIRVVFIPEGPRKFEMYEKGRVENFYSLLRAAKNIEVKDEAGENRIVYHRIDGDVEKNRIIKKVSNLIYGRVNPARDLIRVIE
jgi:hypothetical protein